MDRYIEILMTITLTIVATILFIILCVLIGLVLQVTGVMDIPGLAALFR